MFWTSCAWEYWFPNSSPTLLGHEVSTNFYRKLRKIYCCEAEKWAMKVFQLY